MSIGVAVVGAGHWGPHLIRNFQEHEVSKVEFIVESDRSRWDSLESRFPRSIVTEDFDQALASESVQAVVVATPTNTHFELARRALLAGKHVLVEKPLAHNLESASELCDIAAHQSVVLMVGHVFLFNPAIRAAGELIDRSHLGVIRYLSMSRTNLGPVRRDVDAAWDLGSHDISIANSWLKSLPLSVSATGGSWVNAGVDDVVTMTLRYPHDVLVNIEVSWLNPRKRRLISVVGSDRMLTVDDMDLTEPLRIYDKGVVEDLFTDTFAGFRAQIREGQVVIPHVTAGEPLRAECEEFLARIANGTSGDATGRQGAEVVAVLEAVDRSREMRGAEVGLESLNARPAG